MAYPFSRRTAQLPLIVRAAIPPIPDTPSEWRCLECGKLLGIRRGACLHIRMHGHDYGVTLPVEANCRGCGAYNRT